MQPQLDDQGGSPPRGRGGWEERWREGRTPWDLRGITPPLRALADDGTLAEMLAVAGANQDPKGEPAGVPGRVAAPRVAVPGCGRGHDLRLFAALGAGVVGIDVVPQAVREARRLLQLNGIDRGVEVICRDVFGLEPEHRGAYQLVYDYTCFCAIPHVMRRAYAQVVADLLAPGGVFLHLVFPMMPDRDPQVGPPFRLLAGDVEAAFGSVLTLDRRVEPKSSAPGRVGCEEWFIWRKD